MDIAGFSSLCEQVDPEMLVRLTQEYLQAMCEIIGNSRGTLDKFIGDCIMALWNAPRRLKNHERAAVAAALEMQGRLVQLHRSWEAEEIPAIKFRIGINTDAVLVGNFGCAHRINYTVLGDGVNLASRLEAANKHFGTVVLVAESTRNQSMPEYAFRFVGKITVPGKASVLAVYEPLYRTALSMACASSSVATLSVSLLLNLTDSMMASSGDAEARIMNSWRMIPKRALDDLTKDYEEGMREYIAGNLLAAERAFT
eukprot:RCo005129